MDRLGLGAASLLDINPELVACNTSAFGSTGPYSLRPGVDGLAAAIAGVQTIQGEDSAGPVQLTAATTDHATGLLAAAGVLMGLFRRQAGHSGCSVETSLLDAAALHVAGRLCRIDGHMAPTSNSTQYGFADNQRLYETADGWLAVSIDPLAWNDATDVIMTAARSAADAQDDDRESRDIEGAFRRLSSKRWLELLDLPGSTAYELEERWWKTFLDDPQMAATGAVAEVATERGTVRFTHRWITGHASHRGGSEIEAGTVRGRAPRLGEQTRDVLAGLGYSGADIDHLVAAGIVADGRDPRNACQFEGPVD